MSQSGVLTIKSGGGSVTETLTGNSGGPVGPDAGFNINIVGNNSSGINIVGNPGTNTLTVTAFQATTSQEGTVTLATNAQAIAGVNTANALTSSNLAAKLGTQTAHSLAVFEGSSSALTALGAATNGQLPIGSTGADPVLATLTAGTGISITNGAGSISIAVSGSVVGETITGNTGGALSPTAGNWNILGASTAAGTTPVTTSGAVSTLTVNVQKSQAIAASDATKVGLANFNSSDFSVDANGFVAAASTGYIRTITGNSGGAESPAAGGNFNVLGTGSITVAGSANTETVQLTGLTNHNVLVGAGTATMTNVAPSATSGIPFISQGAAADPTFGTAVVGGGGTGNTTFTAYSVITAGTTATGAFQNVSGVGTAGQVLTSNGASALPTWQSGASVLGIITVNHAASPYTVLATDEFLAANVTAGVITIKLPNAPTTGRVIYIKDSNGLAATSNISITTVGGTVTIDGQTTYTMNINYQSLSLIFDGTNYEVF